MHNCVLAAYVIFTETWRNYRFLLRAICKLDPGVEEIGRALLELSDSLMTQLRIDRCSSR